MRWIIGAKVIHLHIIGGIVLRGLSSKRKLSRNRALALYLGYTRRVRRADGCAGLEHRWNSSCRQFGD
jgi:hypothetical protein